MGKTFNYAEEFKKLDLNALKKDMSTTNDHSQDWWPADYGHYGPLFIRMAWHSGHLSCQRRPRRRSLRYATLCTAQQLAGQCHPRQGASAALADQTEIRQTNLLGRPHGPRRQLRAGVDGLQDLRFAGGRVDVWEPPEDDSGGPRANGSATSATAVTETSNSLAAVQMGLIYVNPEGPNGNPDSLAAAKDIRETFARMAMNDEKTVALIAGGHTLGKAHGAAMQHCRPGARSCPPRGARPGLDKQIWHGQSG